MPANATTKGNTAARRQCRHCGTPFTPHHAEAAFCCAGCEAVNRMIEAQGLDHFYKLRTGLAEPVSPRTLQPADFTPLLAIATAAEAKAHTDAPPSTSHAVAKATLRIDGLHCIGCRWLIAELFVRQPGHGTIEIDMETHTAYLTWVCAVPLENASTASIGETSGTAAAVHPQTPPQAGAPKAGTFDLIAFAGQLQHYGYLLQDPALAPAGAAAQSADKSHSQTRKRLLPRLLLCGLFALNAVLLSLPIRFGVTAENFPPLRLFGMIVLLCATLCVGLAGSYFLQLKANAQANAKHRAARQGVAVALFACYVLVLIAKGLGYTGAAGMDIPAVASFAALFIAFIVKR